MADFGKFTGNTIGEAAAFAAGIAIAPLLEPVVQELRNTSWAEAPDKPLDPDVLAQGAAEGKIALGTAQTEASFSGIAKTPFNQLVAILKKSPGVAGGLDLIRRGQLSPTQFLDVLQKNGLEDEWIAAYQAIGANSLKPWEQPLSPADIALGLIRGNLTPQPVNGQPMFQPGGPTADSNVPLNPVSDLDVIAEAAASGVSAERMATIARNVGLPPGVIEGLNMLNRGIINEDAFYLLIEQSDARLAWGPFLLQLRRMLLTPHEYAELYLRGWITLPEAYAGASLHGLENSDLDLLVEMIGRPISAKQVVTGLARGGTFGGIYEGVPEPFLSSIRESNIRPEWGNLDYANRYTYPSLFQLNALVKANAINPDTAKDWATKEGLAPEVVEALYTFWQGEQGGTAGTPAVKPKAFTYSQIHQAWRHAIFTDAEAVTELEAIGYPAAKAQTLLQTWQATPSSAA